jgi:ABC-type lipoprotein release transport system permease subunit
MTRCYTVAPETVTSRDPLSADLASLRIARDEPPSRKVGGLVTAGVLVVSAAVAVALAIPYAKARVFKTEIATTEIGLVSPAMLGMGLIGGFFPAVAASRVSPIAAMRE